MSKDSWSSSSTPQHTAAETYAKMPRGLAECMATTDLTPRWPTTAQGWLSLVRDSILTDVLRRCSWRGCWARKRYTNLLGIGMCNKHFTEWYT